MRSSTMIKLSKMHYLSPWRPWMTSSLSVRRAVSESSSAWRSSNNWNVGADLRVLSAMVLVVPSLYSMVKSKPRSLLTY
jgi:hypothetical protein